MWRLLAPGLKFKRYLAGIAIGLIGFGIAIAIAILPKGINPLWAALVAVLGVISVSWASVRLGKSITEVLGSDRWAGVLYSRRHLARGPRIVALGGGTGLPAVLRGLKHYTSNLTAIVTVADDGGSSGRLRGDLGMLPPGDLRNCLVALADTEPLMEQLFQHRFSSGELAGHSFGNLFLAAMEQVSGDFVTALRESSRVLAVRGTVLPATLDQVVLKARLSNGQVVQGESSIGHAPLPISEVWMEPPDATPLAESIDAILAADMIVLGPGSLYTSVLPNLLVSPIADAIRHSAAFKVYVANIMTQPGETDHFSLADHVSALEHHVGQGLIDLILVNGEAIPQEGLVRYLKEGAEPVTKPETDRIGAAMVMAAQLLSVDTVIRHDPDKLARVLLRILMNMRPKWAEGRIGDALWLETRLRGKGPRYQNGVIRDRSRRS
ncbi:MAG: YvcK family protein [Firmicutes bacterium]|nr:YvcK family protein [Bacillota bacterium]MCL5971254.1 YvcK family protein [Bacillota bacterium]